MKIYLDNNLGVTNVEQEELTQDTIGYNILKVYIPNAVLTPYNTFTCYYGALLQNGRKVGWFAMEARTSSDTDYEEGYTLYKATLEQCVVSVDGKVYIGCQVLLGNSGNTTLIKKNTAVVQFNVRKSVAINNDILVLDTDQTTTDVLESYKQLLENALLTYATKATTYTKTEVNSALALKADKSDTYTKAQVDSATLNLAGQIASARLELNNKINTTNTQLGITDGKVTTLQDDVSNLQNNVYTKQEVNEVALDLYDKLERESNAISNLDVKTTNLENRTNVLELDFADLKSVQNVVDVVATKSALNSYDTTNIEANDKIQVIADETHDSASTIYNWSGSAWQYVGAFGGNSYTKAEVDTKLSTKADKADTYTKQEVNDKLDGYIKDNDTTYSATVRGKEVIVSTGAGYGSTTYGHSSIHIGNPRKPTCDYYFPEEKSGTLALTSDIPTVNNPTITFTQGGVTKGSISLNQASDQTIDIDAGGSGGSSVVANPTLSGSETALSGLEVDGVKYSVGNGGGKLYLHKIRIRKSNLYDPSGFLIGTDLYIFYSIVTSKNTPLTFNEFMTMVHFSNYGYHYGTNVSGDITISNVLRALNSFSSYDTNDRAEISYIDADSVLKYTRCIFDSVDLFEDTVTEV